MAFTRLTLLLGIVLLFCTGCLYRGNYNYGGSYPNALLPAAAQKIGYLEPRGPFGDDFVIKLMDRMMESTFAKCDDTTLLNESKLNQMGNLPAIYGETLSEGNLSWFTENTDLDYLILTDVGPGRLTNDPYASFQAPADRQASVQLTIYDLADGAVLKTITVTGSLTLKRDKRIWELEASEESMANTAMKKAVKRLYKLSDCH